MEVQTLECGTCGAHIGTPTSEQGTVVVNGKILPRQCEYCGSTFNWVNERGTPGGSPGDVTVKELHELADYLLEHTDNVTTKRQMDAVAFSLIRMAKLPPSLVSTVTNVAWEKKQRQDHER